MPEPRISLTYPAPESSRVVVFIVSGEKNGTFSRALANDLTLPAARLATRGTIHIFAERAAIAG